MAAIAASESAVSTARRRIAGSIARTGRPGVPVSPRTLLGDELLHRGDDVPRGDPRRVEQLRGLPRPRHPADREMAVAQVARAALRERREHRVADAALDPVVLDDDDAATSLAVGVPSQG